MAHSSLKISLLKRMDLLLEPLMVPVIKWLFRPRKSSSRNVNTILIIRPGGIGDAVLLIPAIMELKKRFPEAVIDILSEKRNSVVFSLCSDATRILHYDKLSELLIAIRNNYDAVIDTEQWHRLSAVIARLTRAPMLIGYTTNERTKLFTHLIKYSHYEYEVISFLNLLEPLSVPLSIDLEKPFLIVPAESSNKMQSILKTLMNKRIVALFPGGSIRERQWGGDRFHAVAKRLAKRGYGVVVVGGKEGVKSGREIASGLEHIVDLCGKLSLVETAAVLEMSDLLVTGDSGIMHIAYGLGTPTVSLFGPGIEKKWAPRGENQIVINKHLPCSPCTKFGYTPKCKKDAKCMSQITAEEVYQAAIGLLER